MRALFRLNGWVVTCMAWTALGLLAFIMLGISLEVGMRSIGLGSISGMIEGTEYALYFVTFLSVPSILRSGEHIRVDFLVERLSPAARRSAQRFGTVVIIVTSAVLFWYGGKLLVDHIIDGRLVFKDIVFPQWWLDWPVPLAALTTGLVALEQLLYPAAVVADDGQGAAGGVGGA